ncbi:uncharacterized protein GlcG (DUF336 family) [Rhodobium orientis]|uniref:Cobalamin adenosyltransferase n=1 Tax=Rhodobium orientis TaxID=34017 RepID=A0A327JWM0_9HYPH|nr:heme-binding protein [Rhodobium orientis]MBB4301279.1 uncharacterized protein GlcG (DUF336 family) [Rhodobium orientis]MBK5951131.1 cobalamin adenosyltransferase [Rhodobium orientis]RAI29964.1 cobalamin adenosyltransferase [Rhodobium orientis]
MKVVEPSTCLTFEAGLAAVQAAVRTGLEMERPINAAVVDTGGHLLAFLRAPGAPLHSISIAEDKAFTSASFGLATSKWGAVVAGDDMLRDGLMVRDRLVMFAGGLPISVDGKIVGGIGVSGASAEEDEICATAGLKAIGLAPEK